MKAAILRSVDRYIGTLIYLASYVLTPFAANNAKNKNVLIIKLWALGESMLLLPSIKCLHEKGYSISILCTRQNLAVFEGQKFIDRIYVFDFSNPLSVLRLFSRLRQASFSAAVDAEPFTRFSAVLAVLSGAHSRIGFANRPLLYNEPIDVGEDRHAVIIFHDLLSQVSPMPVPRVLVHVVEKPFDIDMKSKSLVMHAGSASTARSRRWPENRFAEVASFFSKQGWNVYLVGSADEAALNQRIVSLADAGNKIMDLSGRLSVHELAWVFSRASLIIANDSGPMHLAAASGAPTLGLFGPNVPKRFGPYGPKCLGIRHDKSAPCILPFRTKFACRHDHMSSLKVQDVLDAARSLVELK